MKDEEIQTIVVDITSREQFLGLDTFATKHWGEHSELGSPELDFFETPQWAVVAQRHNMVVGQLFVFPRTVEFEGKRMHFVGIGRVVTHTELRHSGVASKMLRCTLDFSRSNGFEFAVLCTEIERLGKLYAGVGFAPMTNPYLFIDKNGIQKEEVGGMIASLTSSVNVDIIQNSTKPLDVGVSNF